MQFSRIRRAIVVTAAALGLSVAGVLAATAAHASDNANGATLYAGNYQCGGATNLSSPQGFVNYHETGDQLTLVIHIKNALPDTTYSGFLYDAFCTPDSGGVIVNTTTNSNGVGNSTVTVTVNPGATYFFTEYDASAFSAATSMQTQAITP
jgi:hypothetical protein